MSHNVIDTGLQEHALSCSKILCLEAASASKTLARMYPSVISQWTVMNCIDSIVTGCSLCSLQVLIFSEFNESYLISLNLISHVVLLKDSVLFHCT